MTCAKAAVRPESIVKLLCVLFWQDGQTHIHTHTHTHLLRTVIVNFVVECILRAKTLAIASVVSNIKVED